MGQGQRWLAYPEAGRELQQALGPACCLATEVSPSPVQSHRYCLRDTVNVALPDRSLPPAIWLPFWGYTSQTELAGCQHFLATLCFPKLTT